MNPTLSTPTIFKRTAAWDGIRIEHYRLNGGDLPEHTHRQHVLIMPVGSGCNGELHTANGLRVRSRQVNGGICLIPAKVPHGAQLDGLSEHLAVYLDPSVITRAADAAHASSSFEVIEKFCERDLVIRNVSIALLSELDSNGLSGHLYAESLANILAVHLLRNYSTCPVKFSQKVGGLSGRKLREVKSFIASNYTRDLRLEELARVAGVSRFHFAREFKKVTGASPHQYLMELRIERAKALLKGSKLPLIEVGLQSGFSHQSHFTRLFRRFTGTTPQSYRLISQRT